MNPIIMVIRLFVGAKTAWDQRNFSPEERRAAAVSGCLTHIVVIGGFFGLAILFFAWVSRDADREFANLNQASSTSHTMQTEQSPTPAIPTKDNSPNESEVNPPKAESADEPSPITAVTQDESAPTPDTAAPSPAPKAEVDDAPIVFSRALQPLFMRESTEHDQKVFENLPSTKYLASGSFGVAYANLCGDDEKDIILISRTPFLCKDGACLTVVLKEQDSEYETLLTQYLPSNLTFLPTSLNGCHPLALIDHSGHIPFYDSGLRNNKTLIFPLTASK